MNSRTVELIREHIEGVMKRLVEKRTVTEPFDENEIRNRNPFGAALVPMQVWKGSKFERSFVTVLGQGIFEQIGKVIAEGVGAYAENQYDKELIINTFKTETIENIIKDQKATRMRGRNQEKPNLTEELEKIAVLENDSFTRVLIRSDLYIRRPDGTEEYYSFKTVKPNLDQTVEAKRNLLRLRAGDPSCKAYFSLPYNPAGEGNPYTKAGHSIPTKLFDMEDEEYVLVGSALWNKIGNDENTYSQLLDIFKEVGEKYRPLILKDYLDL